MRPFLFTVTMIGFLQPSQAGTDGIPEDARQKLVSNANGLAPITVTYTYEPSLKLNKDQFETDYRGADISHLTRRESTLRLDDTRIFEKSRSKMSDAGGSQGFWVSEKTFDDEYLYSGTGIAEVVDRGAHPVLAIERLADVRRKLKGKLFRLDYFDLAGFQMAQKAAELGTPPASLIAQLDPQSISTAVEQQDDEALLRIARVGPSETTTWWLASSKNYCLVKTELTNSDGHCSAGQRIPILSSWQHEVCGFRNGLSGTGSNGKAEVQSQRRLWLLSSF